MLGLEGGELVVSVKTCKRANREGSFRRALGSTP